MRNMTNYQDWVLRAQSVDKAERNIAFDRLVRDYQGMVYAIAYGKLSDVQLAEDVVQNAFLTAYKQIGQLNDVAAFPAWLKRIVMTQADRMTRRQSFLFESIDEQESLPSSDSTPEAVLEASELRQRVRIAMAALPETERDVTQDYYLKGESQREISERLNIPLATVKKRLQYARQHLRCLITGFNETIDRAIYGEPIPQKLFQPVFINGRKRRRPQEHDKF